MPMRRTRTTERPCLQVVAQNFEKSQSFGPFDKQIVKRITNLLPQDLPLELVRSEYGKGGGIPGATSPQQALTPHPIAPETHPVSLSGTKAHSAFSFRAPFHTRNRTLLHRAVN